MSIQNLPTEILGNVLMNFTDPDDVVSSALVCKTWLKTIQLADICKQLIQNTFSKTAEQIALQKDYYKLFCSLQISPQPERFYINSPLIQQLKTIATELELMNDMSSSQANYQEKIGKKIEQLPLGIKEKLYKGLFEVCKENYLITDGLLEWGKKMLEEGNHGRSSPDCSTRKNVVVKVLIEEQLSLVANTLRSRVSDRAKEKAIRQFAHLSPVIKNKVYQEFEKLLKRKYPLRDFDSKVAFFALTTCHLLKSAAIKSGLKKL